MKCLLFFILGVLFVIFASTAGHPHHGDCRSSKPLDVVFLIDTSASIPPADFAEVKDFGAALVKTLSEEVDLDTGVIQFDTEAETILWPDDPINRKNGPAIGKAVAKVIQSVEQKEENNYATMTHLSFFIARTQMLNHTFMGKRCGAMKILILITDGAPSWTWSAYNEARATRDEDIVIYVIGTGADSNFGAFGPGTRDFLAQLFTGGDKEKVFRAKDYSELESLSEAIMGPICAAAHVPRPPRIKSLNDATYKKDPAKAGP